MSRTVTVELYRKRLDELASKRIVDCKVVNILQELSDERLMEVVITLFVCIIYLTPADALELRNAGSPTAFRAILRHIMARYTKSYLDLSAQTLVWNVADFYRVFVKTKSISQGKNTTVIEGVYNKLLRKVLRPLLHMAYRLEKIVAQSPQGKFITLQNFIRDFFVEVS